MRLSRLFSIALLAVTVASCAALPRRQALTMPYGDRVRLASIYIQEGKRDQAVPLLEDAIRQNGERPEAWAMLGEILYLEGDLDGSARHLEEALATGGEDPMVLNNLAWVESERGRTERALTLADRAIAEDPAPLYPYLETRARILLKLGRLQEAALDARTALSLTPEYDAGMREQLGELLRQIEESGGGDAPYY